MRSLSARISIELAKWLQTISISWSKYTAYKLNFFLHVIGPSLVFFLIKYNLWSTIYSTSGKDVIEGYDLNSMLQYQGWILVVGLFNSFNAMTISEDIRMGRVTSYLIYPFSFEKFQTASFMAFQSLQLLVVTLVIVSLSVVGIVNVNFFTTLFLGLGVCLLISYMWFLVQFLTGIFSFWLEETWVLRVVIQILTQFFAGTLLPLDLYPAWIQTFLQFTPFPYLGYLPAKIFMGEEVIFTLHDLLIVLFWIIFFKILVSWFWRRGIRLYTAAGM
ncbi:MAG: ABC-2 family transporter protein [Oligoflexales bacterium]|nr:ABC-2 family transporter protein [Oligoflexales bacterium]